VWSVCLFVRPRVPSVCPVRVSRLPPVSLYTHPGYSTPTPVYRVCVPGSPLCLTGYGYGTVQYTFY